MTTRILVVDDQRTTREVVRDVLELSGCDVREAETCDEALRLLDEDEAVDAVVADILLGGRSGIALIGEIRERHLGLTVVAMSGHGQEVLDAARAAGADACLPKPFSARDLMAALAGGAPS